VGKTRLALQAAAEMLPGFREGAWLVELAPVRDPDRVLDAFAAVFGVSARSGQSLRESLVEFLATKQLLLVVDNCEHVLEAAAELVDTLERLCGGVAVLATSREGIGLDGERMLLVPSLGIPERNAGLEEIAASDAVRLFVERATAKKADFVLNEHNAAAVAQVCRRLDGVPLAIELAAARVPAMSPAVLAGRLDQRFRLLTGGRRGAVERHQTLRAAIDWSYELCPEPERRLLSRLSVFQGGWTLEAAEAICPGEGVAPEDVFECLANLVARSLVVADSGEAGTTRYLVLETIRQYGEERLGEYGEIDTLRDRHAEYYTQFVREVFDEFFGPDQIEAGKRLSAEQENISAAINHAIDVGNVDLAMRLVCNTPPPGDQFGYAIWLPDDAVCELPGAGNHPLYPHALARAALRAAWVGDLDNAERRSAASSDAAVRLGDPERLAEALILGVRGRVALVLGAHTEAAAYAERVAEVHRSSGRLGWAAIFLAIAASEHVFAGGDTAEAVPLATDGLALARQSEMPTAMTLNLATLAAALSDQDPGRAKVLLAEANQLQAILQYENGGWIAHTAFVAARLGEWSTVLEVATAAIPFLHWDNDRAVLAGLINVVARALLPASAETAAVLQGIARRLATAVAPAIGAHSPSKLGDRSDPPAGAVGLVTRLRRETTSTLIDTLGQTRPQELRAHGEAMNDDTAVAYVLDAIARSHYGDHTVDDAADWRAYRPKVPPTRQASRGADRPSAR
jgi:predicted ATPase